MARKQIRKESGLSAENVDGNVDKIREILFGGQMRDYEQRFADLEARLTKNIEHISNAFEKRVERLNTFAKREIEKLAEQVKDERKARREDGRQGAREYKELAQQLESWCAELEEQAHADDSVVSVTSQIHDVHAQSARASSNAAPRRPRIFFVKPSRRCAISRRSMTFACTSSSPVVSTRSPANRTASKPRFVR